MLTRRSVGVETRRRSDAPTLEALVRFGVRDVISNRPLHVRAMARSLCAGGG